MAAIPSEGWTPGSELIVRYRLLAIAIIVVISSLLYIQSRGITRRKTIEQEREALIEKLQSSLAEIKTLSGLLPICSHCKKIRDDRGYWNTLEKYIHDHSDATFSHGICQECSDKIYGDEDWYIKMKKKKSGN